MKIKLFLFIFIIVIIFANFNRVQSQENFLIVSPTNKVLTINDNDKFIEETITIKNNFNLEEKALNILLEPHLVTYKDENIVFVKDTNLENNITILENNFILKNGEEKVVKIKISNPTEFLNTKIHPTIKISRNKNESNSQVKINFATLSMFWLEDKKSTVASDVKIEVIKNNIFSNEITLKGEIKNTGERIFNPAGSISIYKGSKKIDQKEISTQINKNLLPGESIQFEKKFKIDQNNIFDASGYFEVRTSVNPLPFEVNNTKINKFLILNPILFTIVSIIILITFMIFLYFLILKFKKNKK